MWINIVNTVLAIITIYALWQITDIPVRKSLPLLIISLIPVWYVNYNPDAYNDIFGTALRDEWGLGFIGLGMIVGAYVLAVRQDEQTKEVYTLFFYVSLIGLGIMLLHSILSGRFEFPVNIYGWLEYLIPLVFIIITLPFRGGADTDFLLVLWGVYFLLRKGGLIILIAIFIGYLLQFIRQVIACKKEKKSYKEVNKERRPFLMNLYLGFLIGLYIY